MRKYSKWFTALLTAAVCITGCGNGGAATQKTALLPSKQQSQGLSQVQSQISSPSPSQTSSKEATEVSAQFKDGINRFSYNVFAELETGENIFISPYSMAIAISMMDNGAGGQTREEIEQMLGIEDLEDWNACVKYYMSCNQEKDAELLTANSMWLSDQLPFSANAEADFFEPLKNAYGADRNQMDLSSQEALEKINQWVADKTNNMVKPFLTEQLDRDIQMALINAVYFKGEWKTKFQKDDTVKGTFYGKDKTAETDMMCQLNVQYKYTEEYGIKALELPYANDRIAMDIFLPQAEGDNIAALFSNLTESEKTELFAGLSRQAPQELNEVRIPKFDLEYGLVDISESLKGLGMEQAFEKGQADFTKISAGMCVDGVLHKAKIEVDEEGTKAAAATSVEMENDGACLYREFSADRPFLFVIRDTQADMVLFIGCVQNLGQEL